MRLLKTKKKKVWHSVCSGDYNYKDKETFYIVELTEKEFFQLPEIIYLDNNDRDNILKELSNSSKPNESLKELMKND